MARQSIIMLLAVAALAQGQGPFRKGLFPSQMPATPAGDPGTPLFLTPYLQKGQINLAQQVSRVGPLEGYNGTSYSGYFTVDKKFNSNMFFWYFPAQEAPDTAPVVLWLQGGPGGSSLFGLFNEHGPISVDSNGKLEAKPVTWNSKYSMLYIDNPVGTGYSFTEDDAGFAQNETAVAIDLYSALYQFFTMFPDLQSNDFYVTGESYAGKYVPAITHRIQLENPSAEMQIPLKGMAIGDGLCDPVTMFGYADYLFQIGMFDEKERDEFQAQADKAVTAINNKQFNTAFKIFDMLMNGDIYPYPSYFFNVTGSNFYYNFLLTQEPPSFEYYTKFVVQPEVRKAIHVGNLTYNDGSQVEKHLLNDVMDSVKPWVADIFNSGLKVLMYSGQLDIIVAAPLTESFLMSVPWDGQSAYAQAKKGVWKVHPSDVEVAGYVREAKNVQQVIVRGGGHILPYDQPQRSFDMIDRFIQGKPFTSV